MTDNPFTEKETQLVAEATLVIRLLRQLAEERVAPESPATAAMLHRVADEFFGVVRGYPASPWVLERLTVESREPAQ